MNKKVQRGRPLSENPAKQVYQLRLTPEQKQSYQEIAESEDIPLAAWIKRELDRAVNRWQKKRTTK